MKRIRYLLTTSALLVALLTPARGAVVDQMAFEEVARQADVVVLGTVVESPEMGVLDASGKHVFRHHQVAVELYLKGEGATTITVITLGGLVELDVAQGPKVQDIAYLGHPQLPEEGTDVLLFLKRHGSDTYGIYSASHGVIRVQRAGEPGKRWVGLAFKDPQVMPSRSRTDYDRAKSGGYSGTNLVFSDIVLTEDLPLLMQVVLQGNEAEVVPRIQSFRPPDNP